eukprot:8228656-Prorocentrum_lima.AAC.1
MTSSLVGSEMCIRDSSIQRTGIEPQITIQLPPAIVAKALNGELADIIWPVSYTHLTLPTICSV